MLQEVESCPFILLTQTSSLLKWQSVCRFALTNHCKAVAAAMALHPVATASALQLAASCSTDLGHLVRQALERTSRELSPLLNICPPCSDAMDISEYLWEAAEEIEQGMVRQMGALTHAPDCLKVSHSWGLGHKLGEQQPLQAAPPQSPRIRGPAPRPSRHASPPPASRPGHAASAAAAAGTSSRAQRPAPRGLGSKIVALATVPVPSPSQQLPLSSTAQMKGADTDIIARGTASSRKTGTRTTPARAGHRGEGAGAGSARAYAATAIQDRRALPPPPQQQPWPSEQEPPLMLLQQQQQLQQKQQQQQQKQQAERAVGSQASHSGPEEQRPPNERGQVVGPLQGAAPGLQPLTAGAGAGACEDGSPKALQWSIATTSVCTSAALTAAQVAAEMSYRHMADPLQPSPSQTAAAAPSVALKTEFCAQEATAAVAGGEALPPPPPPAPTPDASASIASSLSPPPPPLPIEVQVAAEASPPPPPPPPSLFDMLRVLPADIVQRNLLGRIGPRETCALRLLSREWDVQVRTEWGSNLRLVLGADCVRELRARVERGSQHSLAARHSATTHLTLFHRRLERTVFPTTTLALGLLEVPPVVVDDAPPLPEVLQSLAVASFGSRLRTLHLSSNAAAVSELELELIAVLVPGLEELVLRFDCRERPAPGLGCLGCLGRLRRLGLQLTNNKLNYDPAPERMLPSLAPLTSLRALSLELTAAALPLPAGQLAALTSLRLALVLRGYTAGGRSEQLQTLVSNLGHLTTLRALAVPYGYRGSDGDLLRSAARLLPTLTALHMPRLSATRQELEALARLPMLQHVTLGSLDIAPEEDYEDLLPYDYRTAASSGANDDASWARPFGRPPPPPPLLSGTPTVADDTTGSDAGGGAIDTSPPASQPGQGASPRRYSDGVCSGDNVGGRGGVAGSGGGGIVGSGVLLCMCSWRRLVLCGEQRLEALVAAGPLPGGLREVRLEQLRWPRGSRADTLTARGAASLRALCADLGRLPASAAVHIALEALPGASTANFEGSGGGRTGGPGATAGIGGCGSVWAVVAAVCGALAGVPGLRRLRWSGLLPLLAHLEPSGVAAALSCLAQVSELEIFDGLYGAHPRTSPLFLLHLARGLEAMPRLRRLGLACTAPHNDALAQGLPALLVALRRPLQVEVAFLSYKDAAALRDLVARSAAAAAIAAVAAATVGVTSSGGDGGDPGGRGWLVSEAAMGLGGRGATVMTWEKEEGDGGATAAGRGGGGQQQQLGIGTGGGGPMGWEGPSCYGGWKAGGGLWWQEEEREGEAEDART